MYIFNAHVLFRMLVSCVLFLRKKSLKKVRANSSSKDIHKCPGKFVVTEPIFIISVILSFFLFLSSVHAYNKDNTNEQLKVKAAFILNLARFVEWPNVSKDNEKQNVTICFYQYNFLKESIDTILNKKINNKPVKIKIVKELSLKESCEVVLIPASALSMFVKYNNFENLHERITITDLSSDDSEHSLDQALENEYLLENKIIFRLKRRKSRLHFEINKIASERLGINIGSELLKLGVLVKDQDSDAEREYP